MKKIGIELNGVIRNINKQYLKYYLKDINPLFDENKLNPNVTNLLEQLEFESKSKKKSFVYEDYPFELFGCANPMSRNLHTFLNGWSYDLYWYKGFDDVGVFSLDEDELTIQSTFHYLSKSGTRVRSIVLPRKASDVWDNFDIVITQNKDVVLSKPQGKIVILIEKDDNKEVADKADYVYQNLEEVMRDEGLIEKLNKKDDENNNYSWLEKLKNKIQRIIRKIKK